MDTDQIELRPDETVLARAPSTRVHFQRAGELTAYKMRCDLLLTTERLVGSRRMLRQRQTTPDVDRSRITGVQVVRTLQMRGVRKTLGRGAMFVRIEVDEPTSVLALATRDPELAERAQLLDAPHV